MKQHCSLMLRTMLVRMSHLKASILHSESRQQDSIGVYPTQVHVSALEGRRALWTARLFAISLCFSLSVNMALAFALAALAPLKRVEPMLLTLAEKSDQIVRVEPFQKGVKGFELLVEQSVRNYVLQRETITINAREMEYRWGTGGSIERLTSPAAFMVFQKQIPEYRRAFEQGIARHVTLKSITQIAPRYWTAEFETIDTDQHSNNTIGHALWQATMLIDFLPKNSAYEDRFINPIGFTIMKYTVVKKG